MGHTKRFSARPARWVSAQNWHPKQRARVEKDGSQVLEIPYSDDRELVMEVMKFGPHVEVIEPASLWARVKELHWEASQRYA
jgi:predicted DNA-binding transcriptional regulator YafY